MAFASSGMVAQLVTSLVLLLTLAPPSARQTNQAAQPTRAPSGGSAISGVVINGATGRPIAGALVSLSESKLQVSVGMTTDSKGRFVFFGLPASPGYVLMVRKSGYYNLGRGQFDFLSGPVVRIALSEREWRDREDVVLWPFGAISGIVRDELGEPVVGVPVRGL